MALRVGSFEFFFYSNERGEPRHIHVKCGGGGIAKFWLEPTVSLANSKKMKGNDLSMARQLVITNRELLVEAWDEHFS
jgi:hypothetical protein